MLIDRGFCTDKTAKQFCSLSNQPRPSNYFSEERNASVFITEYKGILLRNSVTTYPGYKAKLKGRPKTTLIFRKN